MMRHGRRVAVAGDDRAELRVVAPLANETRPELDAERRSIAARVADAIPCASIPWTAFRYRSLPVSRLTRPRRRSARPAVEAALGDDLGDERARARRDVVRLDVRTRAARARAAREGRRPAAGAIDATTATAARHAALGEHRRARRPPRWRRCPSRRSATSVTVADQLGAAELRSGRRARDPALIVLAEPEVDGPRAGRRARAQRRARLSVVGRRDDVMPGLHAHQRDVLEPVVGRGRCARSRSRRRRRRSAPEGGGGPGRCG